MKVLEGPVSLVQVQQMITTAVAILPQATGQAQLTEAAPQQPSSEKAPAASAKWNAPVLTRKVRLAMLLSVVRPFCSSWPVKALALDATAVLMYCKPSDKSLLQSLCERHIVDKRHCLMLLVTFILLQHSPGATCVAAIILWHLHITAAICKANSLESPPFHPIPPHPTPAQHIPPLPIRPIPLHPTPSHPTPTHPSPPSPSQSNPILIQSTKHAVSTATGSHPLGSSALRAQSMEAAIPPAAHCVEPARPCCICSRSGSRRQERRRAFPATGRLPRPCHHYGHPSFCPPSPAGADTAAAFPAQISCSPCGIGVVIWYASCLPVRHTMQFVSKQVHTLRFVLVCLLTVSMDGVHSNAGLHGTKATWHQPKCSHCSIIEALTVSNTVI